MPFSPLVHLIALALVGWFIWAARRVDRAREYRSTTIALTIGMLVWIALCTWLAAEDFFFEQNARFLPVVVASVAALVAIPAASSVAPTIRGLVRLLVHGLSPGQTIALQAVRVTALGAVLKMLSGDLPASFVLAAGVPDLLVGLSAFYVARNADRLSKSLLLAWNIAGALVFLVALVAMQLSVPGPLQVFTGEPTARIVISFPMVLVPTFIGPMFILVHFLSIAQVIRRTTASTPRRNGETG